MVSLGPLFLVALVALVAGLGPSPPLRVVSVSMIAFEVDTTLSIPADCPESNLLSLGESQRTYSP